MALPLWATPQRRAILVQLFQQSGGFCIYGHRPCPDPLHHYEYWIDGADVVVEATEYITEPMPFKGSETGFVMNAKTPVKVFRKIHLAGLIDGWKAEDKATAQVLWNRELQLMHQQPDRKGWKRRFDPVSRELFLANRPSYYLEAVGVSGLTFTRVAKVRVPSTNVRLFVDAAKSKQPSKHQLRKAKRYGITPSETERVYDLCNLAVKDFWTR